MQNEEKIYAIAYEDGFWNWIETSRDALPYLKQGFSLLNDLMRDHHCLYVWPNDKDSLIDMFESKYGDEVQRTKLMALLGVHSDS
jgi:hypothetical protein